VAPLASRDILRVWETATRQDGLDRALTLLAAAWPGAPRDVLARLPIGDRDARLLDLHVETFGRAARAALTCPECGERVEFALDLQALRVERPGNGAGEVAADGWTLRFRAPNTEDVAAALRDPDPWRALALRCIVDARYEGCAVADPDLDNTTLARVAAALAECDPQAEILLDYECPACGRSGRTLFDAPAFVWDEVRAQARRLLTEVAALARAYGWREADVVAMSPARRRAYLELVP
jgi:hypothetical protein